MDIERARSLLLALPHVAETLQWGDNLVFWVADKAIGGKMFALIDLEGRAGPVISFAAGEERAAELLEREGFRPAPYLARAHWVAAERWDVLTHQEWRDEFAQAHWVVWQRLPVKTKRLLTNGGDAQQISTEPAKGAKQRAVSASRRATNSRHG